VLFEEGAEFRRHHSVDLKQADAIRSEVKKARAGLLIANLQCPRRSGEFGEWVCTKGREILRPQLDAQRLTLAGLDFGEVY
jgi:hypothetical protein